MDWGDGKIFMELCIYSLVFWIFRINYIINLIFFWNVKIGFKWLLKIVKMCFEKYKFWKNNFLIFVFKIELILLLNNY